MFEQDRFLVLVRESRHRRDRISDKNSRIKSRRKKWVCDFFQKLKWACASHFQYAAGFFSFFGRGKTISIITFGGGGRGGGITSKLASQRLSRGIYFKQAPPVFIGAKDVRYNIYINDIYINIYIRYIYNIYINIILLREKKVAK